MDHHKSLYKDNSIMLPHNKNRKLANENRAKNRMQMYSSMRNISTSPKEPEKFVIPEVPTPKTQIETDKENCPSVSNTEFSSVPSRILKNNLQEQTLKHTSRIALTACKTAEKLTRQEAYLKRFIAWKQKKQAEQNNRKEQSKKPFVPGGVNKPTGAKTAVVQSSFAPKNHKFKAPEGLKDPTVQMIGKSKLRSHNSTRQSFYTIVATPTKSTAKKMEEKKKVPRSGALMATGRLFRQNSEIMPTACSGKLSTVTRTVPSMKKTPKVKPSQAPPPSLSKPTETKAQLPPIRKPIAKPNPMLPPPPPTAANLGKKPIATAGNTKTITKKLPTVSVKLENDMKSKKRALVPPSQSKRNDKPINSTAAPTKTTTDVKSAGNKNKVKQKPPLFKLNNKYMLNVGLEPLPVVETPTDQSTVNPYSAFVTSTKRKSSVLNANSDVLLSDGDILCDTISPVESCTLSPSVKKLCIEKVDSKPEDVPKKFQFVRYSKHAPPTPTTGIMNVRSNVLNSSAEHSIVNAVNVKQVPVNSYKTEVKSASSLKVEEPADEKNHTTPQKKPSEDDRPANYLSPFVSVSRGKVNSRKEKENRNSIYLQQTEDVPDNSQDTSPDTPISLRRTLETVRYFRKHLVDEIARLHTLCDEWERYKEENTELLAESGGDDMINVTIGQTKLLTSKKLMQFSGLIDRCERGALALSRGIDVENDGSDDSKPILSEDLEGFWSMVALQIENVEKRFQTLGRWKSNNWIDPDEVVKTEMKNKKSNLTKVTKPKVAKKKARPNSALQEMLRKVHATYKKSKNAATEGEVSATNGNCVVMTPSKRMSHVPTAGSGSTPRRISVIVKDRRFMSAAPTTITITTPRKSLAKNGFIRNSPKLLLQTEYLKKPLSGTTSEREDWRKSALIGAEQERRFSIRSPVERTPQKSSQIGNSRKSILKTPGTVSKAKAARNVIFNEELKVKRFNFTIEDKVNGSGDEDDEAEKRSIKLRNRRVVLRPSSEFEIPK